MADERITDDELAALVQHYRLDADYERAQLKYGGSSDDYRRATVTMNALEELHELRAAAKSVRAVLFEVRWKKTTRRHLHESMCAIDAALSGHRNEGD